MDERTNMAHTPSRKEQQKELKPQTHNAQIPDPEVVPKATRRRFSAAYKLSIVEEADGCTQPGEIGALLRREGLYSSQLTKWRRQRTQGQLQGLSDQKRGPKSESASAAQLTDLQQQNAQLQARLQQAELIIEVQKKVSQLLGLSLNRNPENESAS